MTSSTNPSQAGAVHRIPSPVDSRRFALAALGGIVALSSPLLAIAGEDAGKQTVPVVASPWEKPAWLTDLSLGVKESYDTNIFLAGASTEYFPKVVPEGTVAMKNMSSWVTTISPKIGVNFVPLLGNQDVFQVLSLGYVPDFVIFHDAPTETYTSNRFTTAIKGTADAVSFSLENAFTYIDGDNEGVIYPGGSSSFVNGTIRERRDQWQERTKASLKYDFGTVFIRPTVSLLYYDLGTSLMNIPGYTNYVDRYDLNGGVDLGYNVSKDMAFTLGYRYGHQYQAALPFDLAQTTATNDYQRVLFGVEGSPIKWLKVEASVGPEFKTYGDNRTFQGVAVGKPTELLDANSSDVYAEASVTVTPTASDAVVFKYKRWNWVSSTGKNPYLDSLFDLSFRHQITKALQLELGARAAQADYNPAALRNDWQYTFSGGLRYAFTTHLSVDVSYSYDRGDNEQVVGVPVSATREFDRSVISSGVQWKF